MILDDWGKQPHYNINPSILWEYDTKSNDWDWDYMKTTVVQRVLQYGRKEDYYAMFQLYGGFSNVKEIVKNVPYLSNKDLNWACFLFNLDKKDIICYTKKSSRQKRLAC